MKLEDRQELSKRVTLEKQNTMMINIKKNAKNLFKQHREVKEKQKNITIIPIKVDEENSDMDQANNDQDDQKNKQCCKSGCIIRDGSE